MILNIVSFWLILPKDFEKKINELRKKHPYGFPIVLVNFGLTSFFIGGYLRSNLKKLNFRKKTNRVIHYFDVFNIFNYNITLFT